jgi:predicted ribosomally synthesized peptide with SipW-like signal peptide
MEGTTMTKAARTRARVTPGKILGTLAAITMVAIVGVVGTTAALSDTTDSANNEFNAGEIDITDNDAGSFMYDVDNVLPGESVESCIQVSYTSTPGLDSDVVLYMATPIGTVGPYVDMTVDVGTQASPVFPDCTGFSADANLYTGTLGAFQTSYGSAATGLGYTPNGTDPWTSGDTVVYRVTLTLSNTARAPGENFSGVHTYTWRADSV